MSKAAELANLIGNINAGGGGVNRNVIINGAMNVAQRATSVTGLGASSGYFVCDRFNFAVNGTDGRVTATQDSSAPSGFANSTKIDVTTADTSVSAGDYFIFQQKMEGRNLQGFAKGTSDAKPFAVSFYVKGNASATYAAELYDGDNSRHASKLFSVTTDWTRVELTFDADTTGAFDDDSASSFELNIWLHGGSSFTSGTLQQTFASADNTKRAAGISSIFDSTDRTFFITGVQIEVGQNPTTFEHESFDRSLQRCDRYYQKNEGTNYTVFLTGAIDDVGGSAYLSRRLRVPMRAIPTFSFSNCYLYSQPSGTVTYTGSLDNRSDKDICTIGFQSIDAQVTQGSAIRFESSDDAGEVEYDAEL